MSQAAMYYASAGVSIVKGIVLVPIYLWYFPLSTYGAWLAGSSVIGLLGTVEGGLGLVVGQRLASANGAKDGNRFAAIAGAGLVALSATAAVLAGLGILLAPLIPKWINADVVDRAPLGIALALAAAGAGLNLTFTNVLAVSVAMQRAALAGAVRVLVQVAEFAAILIMLKAGLGIVAFGGASLLASAAGLAASLLLVRSQWSSERLPPLQVQPREVLNLVTASGPLYAGRIGGAVLTNIETALTSALITPSAAAVLNLTSKAFQVGQSLVTPIASSAFLGLAHLASQAPSRIRDTVRSLLEVSTFATLLVVPTALALNRGFVDLWVGPGKFGGPALNALLAVSVVVATRLQFLQLATIALGKIRQSATASLVEAAVRVPLLVVMLRCMGIEGAPIASTMSGILIGGAYLSYVLARQLGIEGHEAGRFHLHGIVSIAILLAVGTGIAWALPLALTLAQFAVEGFLSAAVLTAGAVMTSPAIRALIRKRMLLRG
jgi:O-antigen/teichoic acid export membrane protein